MSRPRRVYAYCRVSGDEQARHGTSLDAQAEAICAWCKSQGYPAPQVFSDVASGSRERLDDRHQLAKLLRLAEPGDLVVVTKVDRWSRDLVHAVDSIRKLVRSGIRFYAIGEACDPATVQGDQMLGIMAWAADAERQRIKERTVGSRRRLRDMGLWVEGLAPYGYRVVDRRLVIEPREAAVVRKVFAYSLTHSMRQTIEYGRKLDPDHAWDRANWHKSLKRRWYVGEMQDTTGRWLKTHEPIVDADVFARVQEALVSRRHGGPLPRSPRTDSWLVRGLAFCALCGAKMGASYGDGVRCYYVCGGRLHRKDCAAPYLRVDAIDAAVSTLALARLHELRSELGKAGKATRAAPPDGAQEAERLGKQRDRLIDLAADGRISAADLSTRLRRIETRLAALEAERAAAKREREVMRPERRTELLAEVGAIEKAWKRAKAPVRREILAQLAERVELGRDAPAVAWRSVATLEL